MNTPTVKSKAAEMGRVVVSAKIENLAELYAADRNYIDPSEVHWIEIDDALVDTGSTGLGIPRKLIKKLGLHQTGERRVTTTKGIRKAKLYEAVKLTVQGRDCVLDVIDVAAPCPVLIGQAPLELMDFVVDPRREQLVGRHGDEQMYDLY